MPTTDDFEQCRALRHPFAVVSVKRTQSEFDPLNDVEFVIELHCPRCTADRTDEVDEFGDLVRRKYEYPDGYRMEAGRLPPSLQQLRLQLLRQHEGPDFQLTPAPVPQTPNDAAREFTQDSLVLTTVTQAPVTEESITTDDDDEYEETSDETPTTTADWRDAARRA